MITDTRPAVPPSALADLCGMPLATFSSMNAAILDKAVRRVIPENPETVGMPFNSAI